MFIDQMIWRILFAAYKKALRKKLTTGPSVVESTTGAFGFNGSGQPRDPFVDQNCQPREPPMWHKQWSRDIPVWIDSKHIYMFDKFKIKFVTLHHIFQTKQFICSVINNNYFENMNFINIFTWEFLKKSLWSCSIFLFRCQPLSIWTVVMGRALRTLYEPLHCRTSRTSLEIDASW